MSEKDRLNLLSILEEIDNIESYTVKLNNANEFAIDKKRGNYYFKYGLNTNGKIDAGN